MRKVGAGNFIYEEVKGWGQFPEGWDGKDVPAVGVDSQDRLYTFARNTAGSGEIQDGGCVFVFSSEGQILASWGADIFKRPHGMFIGPDDAVYLVDDWGHAVHKFTTDGKLLMTIETAENPADTGFIWGGTVLRSGPPFNYPTGVALSPEGDLYVTDGYGNARVHKFNAQGELLLSWGEPGSGPSQFVRPHSPCVDETGRVYVADRKNARIQVFGPQGDFITQWQDARRPNDLCLDADGNMFVAEWGHVMQDEGPVHDALPGRITVRDLSGRILAELGQEDPRGADLYYAPHGIARDSRGNLYVGEVQEAASHGQSAQSHPGLHKYVRV